MADRLRPFALRFVPVAGAPAQAPEPIARGGIELGGEHIGEQVMVAVPFAPVVQRYEKEVGAIQRLEPLPAPAPPGDGVAERSAQPVEEAGIEQEGTDLLRLALQHFFDQVVEDIAVVAGESGYEGGHVATSLDRQGGQLQRGNPPLGAFAQGRDVGPRQPQAHRAVQVRRDLLEREAQDRRPDFHQLALRA
mgnify:CR=1 FL=1